MMKKNNLSMFIDEAAVQKKIKAYSEILNKKYEGKNVLMIGVLKGCVLFLSDLIRHLTFDVEIDFIACKSYSGTSSTGQLSILKNLDCSIENRTVILVEDILDTGFTLNKIMGMLIEQKPKSLELLTLLDKKECHPGFAYPYHALFEIENKYVVGYGFDCDGHYRNLRSIYVLNPGD